MVDTVTSRIQFYNQFFVPLDLIIFPCLLPRCSVSFRCKSCIVEVSFGPGNPMATCFLHFDQLYFSLMVSICSQEMLLG